MEELDRRTEEVLRGVVEEYIASGDPVGSRTLSKSPRFEMSAATIRNLMADLEESGHLCQPHASAGRVPTDKGYRWYVDHLQKHNLPPSEEVLIQRSLSEAKDGLQAILDMATQLLARLSRNAGVVVSPRLETSYLAHLDFVRLARNRLLVIVATTSGTVQHKVIELDEDYSQEDLSRFAKLVQSTFRDLSLGEVRRGILDLIDQERLAQDPFYRDAMALAGRSLAGDEAPPQLHIEGTLNIMDAPEFAQVDKLKAVLQTFQEKEKLLKVLADVIEGRGICVVIGSESQIEDLNEVSLVSKPFGSGETAGALGVIGPTRMDYDRTVTLVDRFAELVGQRLSEMESQGDRNG